jgi:uncharacterized protein (DUF924 family)
VSETPQHVLRFWREAGAERWFRKDDGFDAEIRARFEAAHHAAARGELAAWEDDADGALALLLLLDQFPRNMYRGSAHAFATDPLARAIAARAIERGFDRAVKTPFRLFFYLPFEHSEDPRDQARATALIEAIGDTELAKWAKLHADIIARFGRFPHRNACLGRSSTEAEKQFLAEGGFAG